RDLIKTLVARDLKVRYRRSAIGFLWTMLHPLITMLVLTFVFSHLFRANLPNFPVYALTGIVLWNFFSQAIVASMNSLRGNAALLTKLPVPKAVFPVAIVCSALVNLLFAMVPLFLIMFLTGHPLGLSLAFVPVAVVVAACFTLGCGLLLAPLAAFFTDTVELVTLLLTILFYLTPVFYPLEIMPPNLHWVVGANPVYWVLDVFRVPIYDGVFPGFQTLALGAGIALVFLAVGATVFRGTSHRIAFYV
ncbi:MAG TPA: ABC transporter permease, partial [Vicinamibacterales bacterium]|nr:ABC transporter permease [Vicinamibacterales bacterium]